MKRVNLLNTVSKMSLFTKVLGFIKEFGIIIAIVLVILFVWQGFFGANGALNLIKRQNAATQAQLELLGRQMELLNQQTRDTEAAIHDLKEQQEAARQHIGTVARKEYHPIMKKIKEANAEEQIEEIHRYNDMLGLSG